MDAASLYCCSAEKKHDDMELQYLHDNMDLLALLDIVQPTEDIFVSPHGRERQKRKLRQTKLKSAEKTAENGAKTVEKVLKPLPPVPKVNKLWIDEQKEAERLKEEEDRQQDEESEEEEECRLEDRVKEEAEDDTFPGHIFTCPAQPFHSRLSVYGEMFPNVVP